ncbi:Nucleotide-binding universal stress protein, UspA family [Microbacterium sp. cf046]|uniref:universal stress protein n=1 Tax=Microbacterium sp. cf046 TaxID=1761803 RepID=UPI0008E5CBC0|nr:universal stress protein [Microbacterium sp. cf046]SFS14166.1 Nucleotide-binding universal stress protein, UspA family [Microbacterium sp. cf046]
MTYVVGYAPHKHDRSAIELACQLARSLPELVVAVSVVPRGWGTPVAAGTDREYEIWAAGEGADSAELAAADLAQHPAIDGSAVWVAGRSVPQALIEQATERDAAILVVGSGDDAEPGRVRLTSKTDRLVHSSTVPVAIAPRGYRTSSGVSRITVAFRDDDASWSLLTRVAEISLRASAQLRVVTFLVRPSRRPVTSDVSHAETQVIDLWAVQAAAAQAEAQTYLNSVGFSGDSVHLHIAEGDDWSAAVASVDWTDGDVLVIGSSSTHRLAQVFLGSSASKIVRHAPVPVVIVPGTATD